MFDSDRILEYPKPLSEVARPCTEIYYPDWSSRGIRAVRCTRPAKFVVSQSRIDQCGVHAKRYRKAEAIR